MSFLDTDRALARQSYYAATAEAGADHPPLQGSTRCDVAVVGAGLAGLSAALDLRARGRSVVVLEAQTVGSGASGRNGGQAIHGLACEQAVIEAQLGKADARRVWQLTLDALALLQQRIGQYHIDCDWRSGWLGLARSPRKAAALARWADAMAADHGFALERITTADMPRWIASPAFHGGVHDPQSGHLHPLKLALGLAQAAVNSGVVVHEHSAVTALVQQAGGVALHTAQGQVQAGQVLLAGNVALHGVAPALAPTLAPRVMPVGTYIACSQALGAQAAALVPGGQAVCDTNFVLDYFRPTPDQRLLYGGRVSYSTRTPAQLAESMRQRMVLTFPQLADARVEYAWGGFVDITMNRAPDFGRLDASGRIAAPGAPGRVYYLQGFSGHGLALTGLAGSLVARAMAGDSADFDVFARLRHRPFPGGALLRTPALVLGMAWYRLRDILG